MVIIPVSHKRTETHSLGPDAPTDLIIWLFFQIAAAHILLPILLATFILSRTVTQHPTLFNVCFTCIIAGIVSALLFYKGQYVGSEPEKGLCIAQMALIAPVPPMISVAILALVYDTWSKCGPPAIRRQKLATNPLVVRCLVAAPYILFLGFAAIGLRFGIQHSNEVSRARKIFYCSIQWDMYNNAIALFSAVVLILATALEVHLAVLLTHNWVVLHRSGLSSPVDLQFIVRVGIFTAYNICSTALTSFADPETVLPDMFAASLGISFFLVFATHRDILRVWADILSFRHYRRSSQSSPLTIKSESTTRCPTPMPSFDCGMLERTDNEVGEKVRLAALHAYYKALVHDMGIEVEVIKRPEDAFIVGREPRRMWGTCGGNDWIWI